MSAVQKTVNDGNSGNIIELEAILYLEDGIRHLQQAIKQGGMSHEDGVGILNTILQGFVDSKC